MVKTSLIHSILFNKENPNKYKWSDIKCYKWLIKHDYYPIKFTENDEHFRFRIIDPKILYDVNSDFRTIDLDYNKGIQAVIAFVNSNNPVAVQFKH